MPKSVRILHLADVHWRGMSRHEEYRRSFESFFKKARELSPDLIYVGGDIFHSKTQGISPELIDCLVWWFREISEIAPTHLILGNHDGIILNRDRQDAISPIVNALNHPQLFLYKESGRFPSGIPGINWCVFSCFDTDRWPRVKPRKGDINIALFHGPVWGSTTDVDWKIEGDVEVSFFKDFDFVFLGDIHRHQFLTEDRRVAYCGSTIQQNYGESPGKGFLSWDIRTRDDFDVEFHEIFHAKPFVTIDWAGSVAKTMEEARQHRKGARFRVRTHDPVPQTEIVQIRNELDLALDASEVVLQDKYLPDTNKISILDEDIQRSDLRDSETHIKLLQEYLKDVALDDRDWEMIEELVRKYVRIISRQDPIVRTRKWSVDRMEFSNTYAYGKNNVINFSNLDGITGIFGRNRRGKSSVIGTLVYTLFNTTDRGRIKNIHVINTRKNYCKAVVDFSMGGVSYRVERQSVKRKDKHGSENAITHLNFWQLDHEGNNLIDLSGEQRRRTEKIIRKRLGTAEDFLLTSLASQGEMNTFIKERATARKANLTRFLGLDIFERMLSLAKEESTSIKFQVRSAPDRDWDAQIADLIKTRSELNKRSKGIDKDLVVKRALLQDRRLALSGFDNADVVTSSDVRNQEDILTSLREQLDGSRDELVDLEKEISELEAQIRKSEDARLEINIEEMRENLREIDELEGALKDLEFEYERAASRLRRQEKSVKILDQVPCGDQFPTCKFIKNSHEDKSKIDDQREKVDDLEQQVQATRTTLNRLDKKDLESRIREFDASVSTSADLRLQLSERQVGASAVRSATMTLEHQTKRAQEALDDLVTKVVDTVVDEKIVRLKLEISQIERDVSELDGQRISIASQLGRLGGEIETLRKERDKYKLLRKKWRVYEHLMRAISKRGIPLQIIQSQLPAINAEIAKILSGVVSFTVELQAETHSNAMDVYINYGDSRRIIEIASGMEKMFASLAIRVALINISSLPKTDMLIIDEGFGSLDDLNVEACNRMLVALKKWFRSVLIITHVDGVKDVVDNVIDVTWNGKDARIVYE